MPNRELRVPESLSIDPWDRFVVRHQKPGNLGVHFLSMLCFYGGPAAALLTWEPWYLAGFFASGILGAFGHWAFDDGAISLREMTSQPEVPGYVVRMFWRMARGLYAEDTRSAFARVRRAMAAVNAPPSPSALPALV